MYRPGLVTAVDLGSKGVTTGCRAALPRPTGLQLVTETAIEPQSVTSLADAELRVGYLAAILEAMAAITRRSPAATSGTVRWQHSRNGSDLGTESPATAEGSHQMRCRSSGAGSKWGRRGGAGPGPSPVAARGHLAATRSHQRCNVQVFPT